MFEILVGQIRSGYEQIQSQYSRLGHLEEELAQIRSGLSQLSGMETVLKSLSARQTELVSQREAARRMLLGLSRVLDYYTCCENRILDVCEQSTVRYVRLELGVIQFPQYEVLKDFE